MLDADVLESGSWGFTLGKSTQCVSDEGIKDLLWFHLRRGVLCVLPSQGDCSAFADGSG